MAVVLARVARTSSMTKPTASNPPAKAPMAMPPMPMPTLTMAMAAPRLAPLDTPMISGEASGLRKII